MKRISQILLLGFMFAAGATAHDGPHRHVPPWQAATGWPDRINATLTKTPQTSFSATWRTDASVGRTIAQITEATPAARFDLDATTVLAQTEQIDLENLKTTLGLHQSLDNVGLGKVHYHSVTFKHLKPDTLYAWRVQGERGNWSEWFQTRTATLEDSLAFVYFGDAQNGIRPNWSRVIRMAHQKSPDARFFLHAGDLVQKGDSDYNWAEWFAAGSYLHAQIPVIPVPGNHERIRVITNGELGPKVRVRTPLWRPQFKLPVEDDLPELYHEQVYSIPYNSALEIFVVDSSIDEFAELAAWLKKAIENSTARWKVVTMHHPYFVPAVFDKRDRDARRRKALRKVIGPSDVDLVITGHIHSYARLAEYSNPDREVARSIDGTPMDVKRVYTISFSGAKADVIHDPDKTQQMLKTSKADFDALSVERVADATPMFQEIRIEGAQLQYRAYTATGECYDEFIMRKKEDGSKQLIQGPASFGETRFFENPESNPGWFDLR